MKVNLKKNLNNIIAKTRRKGKPIPEYASINCGHFTDKEGATWEIQIVLQRNPALMIDPPTEETAVSLEDIT